MVFFETQDKQIKYFSIKYVFYEITLTTYISGISEF